MKPDHTLTQLEEEPEAGLYGCTYTEINSVLKSCLLIFLGISLLFAAIFSFVFESLLNSLALGWVCGIITTVPIFFHKLKKKGAARIGKPLYYHKHLTIYKTNKFIQIQPVYQRERRRKN